MTSISSLHSTVTAFITRTHYRKDILKVLLLKLIGLILLWMFFFGHPVESRLTSNQLAERFISAR